MEPAPTRYARSGDVNIAYRVFGDRPVDLVLTPGAVSNVELTWNHSLFSAFRHIRGARARSSSAGKHA